MPSNSQKIMSDHLDALEARTIFILREAHAQIDPLALLWSIGKDSNALLWMARKAFLGRVPFTAIQLDTGMEPDDVYAFRDHIAESWNLDLHVEVCPPDTAVDQTFPLASRAAAREIAGLHAVLSRFKYRGLLVGIRRDEQAIRAKERVFSPRNRDGGWDIHKQPPELWDQYKTEFPENTHMRIHPLLHWTELDIWRYIKREGIPVVPLYFARSGRRYRSLGEKNITFPVPSTASSIDEIIAELESTRASERAGRTIDMETEDSFERLRASGYMLPVWRSKMSEKHQLSQLKIVTVGHVDHGKSTVIGRLLYDTGSLPKRKVDELKRVSARRRVPMEWSFVLDALQAERDQATTIDATQIWFKSEVRPYVIVDAPGHIEFLHNMLSGAADADAAVLVIDAQESAREQSFRHAYLLHLLGLRQVAVVVNKMDAVDYDVESFRRVSQEITGYLEEVGLDPVAVVPISARHGDNLVARSVHMDWYTGPTLMAALDGFTTQATSVDRPLRLPIQDIYRFDNRCVLVGQVETGTIRVGDELLFSPANRIALVTTIETGDGTSLSATAGQAVGLTLDQQFFIERGEIASHVQSAPQLSTVFRANLFWLGEKPLALGVMLKLKLATNQTTVSVQSIERVIDMRTLTGGPAEEMKRNEVGEVILRSREMLALDDHVDNATTGRFVLVDGFDTVGGGIISMDGYPDQRQLHAAKSTNLTEVEHLLTPEARAWRNGYKGSVIWMTGLSGAGKSTLAMRLEQRLFIKGFQAYVLDGDNVRTGINADLGFAPEDRAENIRRVGEMAALIADAGMIAITAFISPYQADRDRARTAARTVFHEVYVSADLETCEGRDPKGLYRRARTGDIEEFTGVSAPYEPPIEPELVVDTTETSIDECVDQLLAYVQQEISLKAAPAEGVA